MWVFYMQTFFAFFFFGVQNHANKIISEKKKKRKEAKQERAIFLEGARSRLPYRHSLSKSVADI